MDAGGELVLVGVRLRARLDEIGERLGARAPAVDPLRQRVGLPRRDPRGLRHLLQRRLRPVRDHVGDLRAAVAPVLVVHVLDHFLAPLVLDVEVDVGGAVALGREEPLEQQPELDRVGLGDAERVADRAVRASCRGPGRRCRSACRSRRCRGARGSSRESRAARSRRARARAAAAPARSASATAGTRSPLPCARARAATSSRCDPRAPRRRGGSAPRAGGRRRSARAISTVRSTAPGQRAKRRVCSAADAELRVR